MTWQTKAIIIGVTILVVTILAFIVKYQYDIIQRQKVIESSVVEMKQLQDGIVRSQSKYATRDDVEIFAKNSGVDLGPIKKDIDKLGADLQGISRSIIKTKGFDGKQISSTSTEERKEPVTNELKCPDGSSCPDEFGYLKNVQTLNLAEPFNSDEKIPWGEVKFHAWRERPWDLKIHAREYSAITVLSQDENGRHFVYNKFMISADGKTFTIPIEKAEFVERYPEATFSFNPRLYFGMAAGLYATPPVEGEITPNIKISLFSYGQTKINSDWTILNVGIGYETQMDAIGFIISPGSYNIGRKIIPLLDNLHIGPAVSIDLDGNVAIMGELSVGL